MTNPSPETPLTAEQEAEDRSHARAVRYREMFAELCTLDRDFLRYYDETQSLRSRLAAVERERDVLRAAATTFLARFDELMPHVNDYIATACIRVGRNDWGYGHWLGELTAFRAALAASVVTKEETP